MKSVCFFSLQIFSEIFLILRRTERDMIKSVNWFFTQSTRHSYQILIITKFEFSRQNFEKFSCMKFHEKSSSGGRVVSCGRADEQT
jgi:hypothetical protein